MNLPSFDDGNPEGWRTTRRRMFARAARIAAASSIMLTLGFPVLANAATTSSSPYVEHKADFIYNFLFVLGAHPNPGQHSPFTDVPTKSWAWGWMHQALDLGIVAPVSNTTFGANDPVSEAQAAVMAVQYFHVPLKSRETPTAWANSLGLFAGVQNPSALTLRDELGFLQRLKDYHVGIQPTPAGWNMSNQDANSLIGAMVRSNQSVSTQEHVQMNISRTLLLTSAGKKDFQAQAIARQLQFASKVLFVVQRGRWDGLSSATEKIGGTVSQAGQASSVKMQEYINGDAVYTNQGAGWQALPGGQGILSLVQQDLQAGNYLSADGLAGVSVVQTGSGQVYRGALSMTGLTVFASQVSTAMQIPTSVAATVNQAIMQTAKSSIMVHTVSVQGRNIVVGDTIHVRFVLPSKLLVGQGAPQSPTVTRVMKEIQGIIIQETVATTYTYNNTPVKPPASLVSSMAKKA